MKTTRVYFDTEFTGLHQSTTLISIGLIAESGETFYAELTDYDKSQVDDWVQKNVIDKLLLTDKIHPTISGWETWPDDKTEYSNVLEVVLNKGNKSNCRCIGKKEMIANRLKRWFSQFEHVEMWSDCLAYDWVLFRSLFDNDLPWKVYYIPFDICTLFKVKGIDPDISREKYAFGENYNELTVKKHNSLWDAEVIKLCYDKLMSSNPVNSAL